MRSRFNETKEYFTFSRSERRGILVLTILILILIVVPYFYRSFLTHNPNDNLEFNTKVDSFFSSLETRAGDNPYFIEKKTIEEEEVAPEKGVDYFSFDPNTVRIEELMQLGLSLKQAQVVERYRTKGGRFSTPEDFAKVYVIDSALYKKLKPWIKISPNFFADKRKPLGDSTNTKKINKLVLELNSTDTLELLNIKGVGPTFARRIIAYRDLLGGFVNVNQLSEVYGMKPELFKEISKSFKVDSTLVKTINLNLISFEEIKKHPYLTEYQAKAIIYYRSKVGVIKNANELVNNKILPNDKFTRLKNYLVLQ